MCVSVPKDAPRGQKARQQHAVNKFAFSHTQTGHIPYGTRFRGNTPIHVHEHTFVLDLAGGFAGQP